MNYSYMHDILHPACKELNFIYTISDKNVALAKARTIFYPRMQTSGPILAIIIYIYTSPIFAIIISYIYVVCSPGLHITKLELACSSGWMYIVYACLALPWLYYSRFEPS